MTPFVTQTEGRSFFRTVWGRIPDSNFM